MSGELEGGTYVAVEPWVSVELLEPLRIIDRVLSIINLGNLRKKVFRIFSAHVVIHGIG